MMLEAINVRFFLYDTDDSDFAEVEYQEFVEVRAIAEALGARTDIEKHSIFANGCRQLCITLWADRETGEPV